jgi:hypothetical protein
MIDNYLDSNYDRGLEKIQVYESTGIAYYALDELKLFRICWHTASDIWI